MGVELSGCCPLLSVFDMPASLAFYCDALGFEIAAQSGPGRDFGWGLLRRKGTELMLNTAYERELRPAKPDPARIASHGDTILYFGFEDLDEWHERLRAKGVEDSLVRDEAALCDRPRRVRAVLSMADDPGGLRPMGGGLWVGGKDGLKYPEIPRFQISQAPN